MKFARWIAAALIGLILLAFVADTLVRRLSFEEFRHALDDRISSALGVDVEIAGDMRLELLPTIQLEVADVTVANPPGAKSADLIRIKRLWLNVKVLPLLREVVEVEAIELSDVDLFLETNSAGKLVLPPGLESHDQANEEPGTAYSFRARKVTLEDIRISYLAADGTPYAFEVDELTLEAESFGSPIHADGKWAYRGGQFEFTADTGRAASLFEASEPFAVDLDVRLIDAAPDEGVHSRIKGSVRDVAAFTGVALDVELDGGVSSILENWVDRSIPEGSVNAEFRLSDASGSLGVEDASVVTHGFDAFQLELRGKIADIRRLRGIDVKGDLSLRDPVGTAALFDFDLPEIGPVAMKGRVQGSKERLESNGTLQIGETLFEGDLNGTFAEGRKVRLDGVLTSSHVRLVDFGLAEAVDLREKAVGDAPSLLERWWSHGEALPVESLRDIDLDFALRTQILSGRGGFKLEDFRGDLDLEAGFLAIHDVRGSYDEGRFEADLRTDARPEEPTWSLHLEAYNVNLDRTVSQFSTTDGKTPEEPIGRFDITADLTSVGSTRADMASSLGGRVHTMLRDGNLVTKYGREFFHDYLRLAVPEFLKLRRKDKSPDVQCLIGVAPIRQGVAEIEQLFMQGDRISIAGSGSVDLAGDAFKLRLAPRVHDPGLVTFAATVDVSGPLDDPVFTPLPSSIAKNAGRAIFENTLRPLRKTLQVGLGLKSAPVEDPCAFVAAERARHLSFDTAISAEEERAGIAEDHN